jgi:DNA polymerase-3 subunit alpha
VGRANPFRQNTKHEKQESEGQSLLFSDEITDEEKAKESQLIDVDDFTLEEKLAFEKEFLGFYLTSHPHMELLSNLRLITTHEIELLESEKEGAIIKVGGVIEVIRKIFTKKTNAEMAFVTIGDDKGITIEAVIFPKTFEESKKYLIQDTVIIIDGKLDSKDDRPVLIANKITPAALPI